MTTKLLLKQQRILEERRKQAEQDAKDKGEGPPKPEAEDPNAAELTDSQNRKHKGVLKIDATCADAEVRYPVDSTLLETACRKIDEYTSKVCKEFGVTGKKTHYKDVRRSYLLLIKQKVKKGRQVKDTIAYLLNCLTKDLRQLLNIFAEERVYRANDIRAKLPDTARCWTGMCYFVKNVMKFLRELCHALIELWHLIMNMVTDGGYVCPPLPW